MKTFCPAVIRPTSDRASSSRSPNWSPWTGEPEANGLGIAYVSVRKLRTASCEPP